jgi:hypothetical protein
MLREFVLTVCLHTGLPCADIDVSAKNLNKFTRVGGVVHEQIAAQAYMTNFGNIGVWYDAKVIERDTNDDLLELAVHEVAHLMAFKFEYGYDGHGHQFTKYCKRLADSVGVDSRTACAASGH